MPFNRKKLCLALIVILTGFNIATHFGHIYPDSSVYVNVSNYFLGKEKIVYPWILVFRPLTPLLASFLAPLIGLVKAFSLINSIFWILTIPVFYGYSKFLLENEELAVYSTFLLTFSVPLLMVGAGVLVDMGAYFFIASSLYLFEKAKRGSRPYWPLLGLSIGTGALIKEVVLTVLGCVFIYALLEYLSSRKIRFFYYFLLVTMVTFIPITIWFSHFNLNPLYHYFYLVLSTLKLYSLPYERLFPFESWIIIFLEGILGFEFPLAVKVPIRYVISFLGAYHIALFLLLRGLNVVKRSEQYKKYLVLLLPFASMTLLRPYIERRRAFYLFPIILPLSTLELSKFSQKNKITLLILYFIISHIIFIFQPGFLG